jgi:hypothetical protein
MNMLLTFAGEHPVVTVLLALIIGSTIISIVQIVCKAISEFL